MTHRPAYRMTPQTPEASQDHSELPDIAQQPESAWTGSVLRNAMWRAKLMSLRCMAAQFSKQAATFRISRIAGWIDFGRQREFQFPNMMSPLAINSR